LTSFTRRKTDVSFACSVRRAGWKRASSFSALAASIHEQSLAELSEGAIEGKLMFSAFIARLRNESI
jgi:hypothetical protein